MRRLLLMIPLLIQPVLGATDAVAADDEGFVSLVNGTDPNQFDLVEITGDTISINADGVISVTGKPNGYFATKDSYTNYVLKFDWMYERPDDLEDDAEFNGNSGLLLHIGGEPKVWPKCVEAQLMNRDAGHVFGIGGGAFESKYSNAERKELQAKGIKPVGQWNEEEVICKDGMITCIINGVEIDSGTGAVPDSGPIGWQSEGRPLKFRNLMIKVLD